MSDCLNLMSLLVGRGAKCACASHGCVLAWTSALSFATAAAILCLRHPLLSRSLSLSLPFPPRPSSF